MDDSGRLSTIGYQGKDIGVFLNSLAEAGIELVVDVRRRPISRRHDYSKSRLKSHLESFGIEYLHVPELGMPEDLLALRDPRTGNSEILDGYASAWSDSLACLERITGELRTRSICLLCFEADAMHCHRHVVADKLAKLTRVPHAHL